MITPTFDKYGYPSKKTLRAIEEWDYQDAWSLMAFVHEAWNESYGWFKNTAPKLDTNDGRYWCCTTGGWSGNEDILRALASNMMVYAICWNLSWRGGYHEYHMPDDDFRLRED